MASFKFDEKLRVGNRLMDREHAILIEYLNTLEQVMEGNSSRFLIGQVLAGLVEYTNTHFYIEEELMNTFTYPDYLNHKTAHDKFRLAMRQLVEQHKSGAECVPPFNSFVTSARCTQGWLCQTVRVQKASPDANWPNACCAARHFRPFRKVSRSPWPESCTWLV